MRDGAYDVVYLHLESFENREEMRDRDILRGNEHSSMQFVFYFSEIP